MLVRTCQSNIHVAQAARTQAFIAGKLLGVRRQIIEEPGYIGQELKVELKQGETLVLEKLATFYTSRDHAISECSLEARQAMTHSGRFEVVLARSDRLRAMNFFAEALQSDTSDIQQGTTAEGVHLGAMAGSVDLIQRVSTGIEVRGNLLHLNPELPKEMKRLDLRIRYRRHSLDLRLTRDSLTIRGRDGAAAPISLCIDNKVYKFVSGTTRTFRLNDKEAAEKNEENR